MLPVVLLLLRLLLRLLRLLLRLGRASSSPLCVLVIGHDVCVDDRWHRSGTRFGAKKKTTAEESRNVSGKWVTSS